MPSDLSGGMKKRVALARSLALDPEVVLFDEPTTGLDPITSATIGKLINSIQKELGVTAVVVTHDIPLARRVGDRIAFLSDGQFRFLGDWRRGRPRTAIRELADFLAGREARRTRACRLAAGRHGAASALVILAAVAVLAVGVFLIGDQNNLFSRKNRYYTEFHSASGLKQGNPVQLNGVDVGTIEQVILPRTRPRRTSSLDPRRAPLRRPHPRPVRPARPCEASRSRARIKTLGLLGDKYIEITSGSPDYPVIPSDGPIPAAPSRPTSTP